MSDDTNNDEPKSDQPGWAAPDGIVPQSPPPVSPESQGLHPVVNPYQQPVKKKSKLWLWITLAIVIPLLLCGLGVGGCTLWLVGTTKPAVDATNDFYKKAKEGVDVNKYVCDEYKTSSSDNFNSYMKSLDASEGPISTYDFKNIDSHNGEYTVRGTVVRSGTSHSAVVVIVKESGKYKVCGLNENTKPSN